MTPNSTRLFFTVYSETSEREIFNTLQEARQYAKDLKNLSKKSIVIDACIVRNAYREDNGWNYDDYSDTFDVIKVIDQF